MKLIAAILSALVSVSAGAATDLNQKVTLMARNVTSDTAFKEIARQADVKFIVSPEIKFVKKISIDVKQASLKEVLDFLVNEQNLKWESSGENSIKISAVK
jgi:hypothetical protein